jgi:Conserved TM helix
MMANPQIIDSLYNVGHQFVAFIPTLVGILILIIVGWILGKFLGRWGAKVLDKVGLDDLIDKTAIGGMIKKVEMSTVGLFEAIIKWFVYIIFALIIIDILQINVVAEFVSRIILYIPLIISALVVLIIGLLAVDFLTNLIRKVLIATGVDEKFLKTTVGETLKATNTSISGIISGIIKLFGYLIFLLAATEILQLARLAEFLNNILNYLPNLFIGILILIIGFLSIDFIADYLEKMMAGMKVEGSDVIIPVLRGFMFLVVLLLALDSMLIKTTVFYTFLGPLAWGFAVVVAFKWGIKDAIVAYAKERK